MGTTKKRPPLAKVVWANIISWMIIHDVEEEEICALLGVKSLYQRKKNQFLTIEELEKVAAYLMVEPEKLFNGYGG